MAEIVRQTQDLLARYLSRFPGEAGSLLLLQQQLGSDAALFTRSNMKGHVTSSAAVLTPDGSRILLIHHAFLKKWLTPGGHYEGLGSLFESALREVREETGLAQASAHRWTLLNDIPLDIETLAVPARLEKSEGAHAHHDFLFLAVATESVELQAQLSEVHDAAWTPVAELRKSTDRRVRMLHQKLLDIGVIPRATPASSRAEHSS